jgi:hypothetical protein
MLTKLKNIEKATKGISSKNERGIKEEAKLDEEAENEEIEEEEEVSE